MEKELSLSAPASPKEDQNLTIEQALVTAHGHWNAGQANQAEILCQKVLAVWPGNPDASHLLGIMSHNWGNLDLAIDYLRKACQSPRAPAVYFSNLAEMCRQKSLFSEGETAARRAVSMDAALIGGWNNLGILLQEMGKYDESLTCLQRVIALKPDYAEAYNNLGNTFKRLGQLDRAQICYAKALELAPNYAGAHSNLSNLLKDFAEYDRALTEAKRAIEIDPCLSDAYINAAAVETARLRHEDAARWLDALLAFAPTNAMALAAKAATFNKLDLHDEALAFARRAVMAAPEDGDPYNALGQTLQALEKYDEAQAAYDLASNLKCTVREQGHINKGLLLMEINRTEEARDSFAKALTINPRSTSAFFNVAELKTFQSGDPAIDRMEEMLTQNEVQSYDDRMALRFALSKAWLDVGDDKRAFGHLTEGNRMKRATIQYDAGATDLWIKSIPEAFPASLFNREDNTCGDSSDLPIFILGMPRSGTTLLEQILAAHPDVLGAGELSLVRRIVTQLRDPVGMPLAYPECVASLSSGDLARIGRAYVDRAEKLSYGHKRIVDKMPANFLYTGLIALSLPRARIIHCRRDAVDTCFSCYTKLFNAEQNFTYDLAELGRFYCAYEELMDHWRRVLSPTQFIEVNYEDVVNNLEAEARRMITFCDLPWNDACLSFHKSDRPIRTASVNQVRRPIYKQSVDRWKRYATHLDPLLAMLNIADPNERNRLGPKIQHQSLRKTAGARARGPDGAGGERSKRK